MLLRVLTILALACLAGGAMPSDARADDPMRPYVPPPPGGWTYLSDQVMGGVSEGRAIVEGGHLRLTGDVSTLNRGGFIQVRTEVPTSFPKDAQGLVIRVRGNGEGYFVHLRTRGTVLPWQYYQAPFETSGSWQDLRVPFTAFAPSGRMLRSPPRPETVTSVGFVAYGRDHRADLSAIWLGIY